MHEGEIKTILKYGRRWFYFSAPFLRESLDDEPSEKEDSRPVPRTRPSLREAAEINSINDSTVNGSEVGS